MAEELRWENLAPANTTGDVDSAAEFRNDSSRDIHIREINYAHFLAIATTDERASIEISKSPTIQAAVNNGVFFLYMQALGVESSTTGAASDDGTVTVNGGRKWARGQLTLEPGESLYVNQNVISGAPTMEVHYMIGYHF